MNARRNKTFLYLVLVLLVAGLSVFYFRVNQKTSSSLQPKGMITYEADHKLLSSAADYLISQRLTNGKEGIDSDKFKQDSVCKFGQQATDSMYLYAKMSCSIPQYDNQGQRVDEKFSNGFVRFKFDTTNTIIGMDEPISVTRHELFFPQEVLKNFQSSPLAQ